MDKKAIIQRALDNINHPLSEITRRTTYRARSPGVAPVSGIKMALPKTSTMAKKMQKVLDDETPAGRKKQKQMANLVIGREEDDKEILLQFKTAASREKFRKLMNEDVQIDEEKSLFDISPTSSKWMKGRLRTGYNKSQKSGMPKEMFKKGQVIDLHPFDGDRFVGAKSPKDKGSYFFVAKRHVDAMKEDVQLDEETQHIVHVNVSRTGFRKLEAMIASLNGYRESDYSDGKARFYFDAKKHDSAERKKVAEFIKKTRGAEFSHAMKLEDVQLDEGTMNFLFDSPLKAGAFAQRIMRDKLASEVDRYVDHGKRKEVVELITHPNNYEKNDILKLAKKYKGTVHSVEEDVQLDETNFRFPQPGEYYGDLGKSISDDPYDFADMSRDELRKRSRDIERKFAVMMRKHKGTKVGEVLDLLDKDGNTKVHQDNDIKLIKRYLTKFKDNVRKVAHQMMIDFMEGDDYLAKKRIPVREDVQLDETMTARDLESMIKGLKRGAKQEIADALNDMNLSGYGDYEARVDNIHKFKTKDLFNAMKKVMKLESLRLEERAMTYVIDRKTKKIVHGPTDTGDAKLYLKKQIQPRKFMIRQIRGAAKKVGDTV